MNELRLLKCMVGCHSLEQPDFDNPDEERVRFARFLTVLITTKPHFTSSWGGSLNLLTNQFSCKLNRLLVT